MPMMVVNDPSAHTRRLRRQIVDVSEADLSEVKGAPRVRGSTGCAYAVLVTRGGILGWYTKGES